MKKIISTIALLAAIPGTAVAQMSDKDFARCLQLYRQQADWLESKADQALQQHRDDVADRIDAFVNKRGGDAGMRDVVERLIATHGPEDLRRRFVTDPVERLRGTRNEAGFECLHRTVVRRDVQHKLMRYEMGLDELGDVAEDRLALEDLQADEGLVAVYFHADGFAQNVVIDRLDGAGGNIGFGPILDGDYFRVFRAKAGRYRWDSVWYDFNFGNTRSEFDDAEQEFDVVAGRINYTGLFRYKVLSNRSFAISVRDRASMVVTWLEQRYPELLNSYPLHDGLNGDNRFFDFYLAEKAAWADGDVND